MMRRFAAVDGLRRRVIIPVPVLSPGLSSPASANAAWRPAGGRRDPQRVHVGEALDFRRVEETEPGRPLRLRAEMRMPGDGWLELRADVGADGGTVYRQQAIFLPRRLPGHLYWWAVSPFHAAVFGGMLRNIVHVAEATGETPGR
jgi:hypothetical protein